MAPRTTGHRIVGTMASGSTRRPRVRRPTQTQIAAKARFLRNIEAGRQMGLIPEAQTPPTTEANGDTAMGTEEANGPTHQPAFEDNQQNQWEDYDPILAHASYHRMRRYAERQESISAQWAQLETAVTSAFLDCQYKTLNWTCVPTAVDVPLDSCTCLPNEIESRKVDLIDMLCMFFSSSHDLT
ncbi:hypothetical protein PtB15_5B362 [Puccinia triticina]|nr:hypothetical protein PtB15_5B362 [Puccinia triticina]